MPPGATLIDEVLKGMAVQALEVVGPQEYDLKPVPLTERFAVAYGDDAAAEVAGHLPGN